MDFLINYTCTGTLHVKIRIHQFTIFHSTVIVFIVLTHFCRASLIVVPLPAYNTNTSLETLTSIKTAQCESAVKQNITVLTISFQ